MNIDFKKLRIITTKDPKSKRSLLRNKCVDVEEINCDIIKLSNRMIDFVKNARGCGLAAPQLGINYNIIVVKMDDNISPLNENFKEKELVIINPKFEPFSKNTMKIKDIEGCLSVPNKKFEVERYEKIIVNGKNIHGDTINFIADGLLSRIIQHECDHLSGVMICDVGTIM